jgi:hypothetical protein
MSLEECAVQADTVFVGTVVDIQTRWGDTGKLIWTDYVFKVQDTWKGAPGEGFRTVSVGGGTAGDKTIILTEVPSFQVGGTYAVYAYDNARLIAEAVVGVDQGLFREVADAETGQLFLIDARGYRMEVLQNGCIVSGRLTQRVGDTQKAHVFTDDELVAQQVAFEGQYGPTAIPPPVVRDAGGNILPTDPAPPKTLREKAMDELRGAPQGEPLSLDALKTRTLAVLGLTDSGIPAISPARPKGGM